MKTQRPSHLAKQTELGTAYHGACPRSMAAPLQGRLERRGQRSRAGEHLRKCCLRSGWENIRKSQRGHQGDSDQEEAGEDSATCRRVKEATVQHSQAEYYVTAQARGPTNNDPGTISADGHLGTNGHLTHSQILNCRGSKKEYLGVYPGDKQSHDNIKKLGAIKNMQRK